MDLFAALLTLLVLNAIALGMAAYVDHRTRRRIRAGELPHRMPWLIMWFGVGIDPFYLFSPMFRRLQDHTTQWLVWPLRIIVGGTLLTLCSTILFIGVQIWLDPA